MNRKLLMIMTSVLLFLVLVGCNSSEDTDAESKESAEGSSDSSAENTTDIDYPEQPIELIVPYSSGGGTDAVGRALADSVEEHIGESVGVVNKTGGGGSVGMAEGANADPDGHTLTMVTVELTMLPHMGLSPVTYEDFIPIAQFNFDPSSIVVPADAPYDTIEEFIEHAKENPGEIRIGNGGTGSAGHLSAAALEKETEVEFNHVPFEGSAPAVTAALGGHVEALAVQPPEVLPQVESGDLKTLAIMADEKLDVMPDVPTFEEAGYDIGEIGVWRGVTVPKGTPEAVVNKLSEAFMAAAKESDFKEFMNNNGLGIVIKDGEAFKQQMADSNEVFGELIPELDIE